MKLSELLRGLCPLELHAKEDREITGICYEPWHYRYVGREAAKEIKEKGLCLEEYLSEPETGG